MTTSDQRLEQILNRLNDHSKRLMSAENAVNDALRLAMVVNRLSEKINGNGMPGLDEQIRLNSLELTKHQEDLKALKDLEKTIQPMITFFKVGVWFSSLIGVSIIALIWGLLTGQVTLSYGP